MSSGAFKPLGHFGMYASATLMAGVGAELGGGKFWQGAVTGLAVVAFNHGLHIITEPKSIDAFFNKFLESTQKLGRSYSRLPFALRSVLFYDAVRTGGFMDLKNSDSFKEKLSVSIRKATLPNTFKFRDWNVTLEDLGNYNIGVFSNAVGFPYIFAQMGAGYYQIYSGTSIPEWYGPLPMGGPFFGDDPKDAYYIQMGYKH